MTHKYTGARLGPLHMKPRKQRKHYKIGVAYCGYWGRLFDKGQNGRKELASLGDSTIFDFENGSIMRGKPKMALLVAKVPFWDGALKGA